MVALVRRPAVRCETTTRAGGVSSRKSVARVRAGRPPPFDRCSLAKDHFAARSPFGREWETAMVQEKMAGTEAEFDDVRALMRAFVEWHYDRHAECQRRGTSGMTLCALTRAPSSMRCRSYTAAGISPDGTVLRSKPRDAGRADFHGTELGRRARLTRAALCRLQGHTIPSRHQTR